MLLLVGCAHGPVDGSVLLESLTKLERNPSLDPATLEDVDVLGLNEEAKRFIKEQVRGIDEPYEKVRELRRAVFDSDRFNFIVDDEQTYTATETFEAGGGNCLSLANFFVAATRLLGIDANYQEVQRRGLNSGTVEDFRVIERHINVSGALTWQGRQARYVLDYLSVPEEDFKWSTVISDKRALAHYYNNLAMDHFKNHDIETTLQYLKKAILTDAGVDFVWSNLGVVYSRRGDWEAAEFAYQQALNLNPDQTSALKNLPALYKKWGKSEKLSQ